MAETVINGNAGGADFTVAAQSYKTTLNRFRVRMDVPQIDATTFNDEPNYNTEPGPTIARFDLTGIMKQGAASSGPFMPPPQGAALNFQYSGTNNAISFLGNFETAEAERVVNSNGIITGSGVSKGAITIAWKKT
jgi:hypothetical protein